MSKNLIIIVALALILIAGGAWYFLFQQKPSQNTTMEVTEEQAKESTPAITPTPGDAIEQNTIESAAMEGKVKEFTIEGNSNLRFSPNQIKVSKGDTVRITFKVVGDKHDFRIDEFDVATSVLDTGEEETVEFVADKAGAYQFYCGVPGHRAAGMVGTLSVE